MTATYDGHLVIDGRTKRILPCCEVMAEASYTPIMYVGLVSKSPALLLRLAEKKAKRVTACPFCGAAVEVRQ